MKINKDIQDQTTAYRTFLQLEKSLSPNSVEAYMDDLNKLLNYLQDIGKTPEEAGLEDLQAMIVDLREIGISPRSQARIVSGIKSFYRFLLLENYIRKDPTELLESPKIGLRLPEFLTLQEINNIIGSIDLSLPEGQRNRAILETLYS
jgi:integrase/recombinase XerD